MVSLSSDKYFNYIYGLTKKTKKMKKTLILLFVAALGAGTMSSCKKSNKGKLSGEWTVASMSETDASTSGNPSVTNTTVVSSTDGAAVSIVSSSTAVGSTDATNTGVINAATWNIEKDGTWSRTMDVTLSGTETGYTWTSSEAETTTGTWSFVGKDKSADFKRNDRVIFNTLTSVSASSDSYTVTGGNPVPSSSSDSYSWATGENQSTYVITESKKKELVLTQDGSSTWSDTDAGGTTSGSSTLMSTISLIQD
jgi:hypothetical protein